MKLSLLPYIALLLTVSWGGLTQQVAQAQFSLPEIELPRSPIPPTASPFPSTLGKLKFQNVRFHDGCRAEPRTVNRLSFDIVDLDQSGSSRPNWDLVSKVEAYYAFPEQTQNFAFRALPDGDNDSAFNARLRPNYDRASIDGVNRQLDTNRLTIVAYASDGNVLANTQISINPLVSPTYRMELLEDETIRRVVGSSVFDGVEMRRVVVEGEVYYAAEMRVWNAGYYQFQSRTPDGYLDNSVSEERETQYLDLETNRIVYSPFELGQRVAALLPARAATFDNFPNGLVRVLVFRANPYSFFDDRTTLLTTSYCANPTDGRSIGARTFFLPNSLRPQPEPRPDPPTRDICSDGRDNDGDGLIDFPNDPGCDSRSDNSEYNVALVSYRSLRLTNCTTQRYRVNFWRRDLTTGGDWTQIDALSPQYNSFGTCPHSGSSFVTVGFPQDGHIYEVVAVTPESTGCGRNDPNTLACVKDSGIFRADSSAGVGTTYIY